MNDSIESNINQQADMLLAQRASEPDASRLAEKIVLASQNLPQDIVKPVDSSVWGKRFRQIFAAKLFSSESLVFRGALVCLVFVVISGVWFMPQPGIVKTQSIAQNIGFEGDVLSEEFSWDSLLIMQDELAFAEL